MGKYNSDWFSFEVESRRHIMDLIIEPSFAKTACFQVHETADNSFKLFWNFGMVSREIISPLMEYAKLNKIDLRTPMTKVCCSEDFAEFMRQNAPPINIADLSADDMALVDAVDNADWRDVKYRCGLDGHDYTVKIYGEPIREFKCWCVIPKEYGALIPLVDRLIDIAKLEPCDCYAVSGVR